VNVHICDSLALKGKASGKWKSAAIERIGRIRLLIHSVDHSIQGTFIKDHTNRIVKKRCSNIATRLTIVRVIANKDIIDKAVDQAAVDLLDFISQSLENV